MEDLIRQLGPLYSAGRLREAEALCRTILARQPKNFTALHTLGAIFARREQFQDAVLFLERALQADPASPFAWNAHGSALRALKRLDDALASYDKAIALKPDFLQAFYNRALTLHELERPEEALAGYGAAIALHPQYVRAVAQRGSLLLELGRLEEALADCARAHALELSSAEIAKTYGEVLYKLHRLDEARAIWTRAAEIDPDDEIAVSFSGFLANQACDWTHREHWRANMVRLIKAGKPVSPFVMLHTMDSPALHLKAARAIWRNCEIAPPRKPADRDSAKRLRLAYLSADIRHHPVAYAIVELIERHTRENFEVWIVALNPSDGSAIRARLEGAADHFVAADRLSDEAVASLIEDNGIDILVDLTGHTENYRPRIFARRPAPIAVNYLGFSGTIGSKCIDYILADAQVIPEQAAEFYMEKVVYLPDTFFVTDTTRTFAAAPASRGAHGLPEQGFVFCGFTNSYKLNPELLDVWARLLQRVPGSVLWLNIGRPDARSNLTAEFQARGIGAERLAFTKFLDDAAEHLARLKLADLFLDTLPYNGHSTCCDLLYAGVPAVTCSGQSFAARVAASLLRAAGLSELITGTLADYEALAVKLATDPDLLGGFRAKLAQSAPTLFDTARTARHIETAYRMMWDRYCRGLPPQSFSVEPQGKGNQPP